MAAINSIATSLFQGAPTDKLPVADIFDAPAIDILSTSVDGVKKVLGNVFSSIRSQGLSLSTLASMVKVQNGKVSLNSDQAKSRLNSMLGVNVTSLTDLPAQQQLNAISRLTALAGINTNSLTSQAGDIVRVADGVNAKDVNGVFNALQRVVGKNDLLSAVVDDLAQQSFLGSLLSYSVEWGLVDAIDTVMDKYEVGSNTRDYLEYTLVTSFSAAIANGVLDTLLSIITNTGRDKILAMYPNAVNMVLQGFVFAADATAANYPTIKDQLINILNLLDANWATTTRNGSVVTKTEPFLNASNDAKTALSYDDTYWKLIRMAPSYPSQDVVAIVKAAYPTIAL